MLHPLRRGPRRTRNGASAEPERPLCVEDARAHEGDRWLPRRGDRTLAACLAPQPTRPVPRSTFSRCWPSLASLARCMTKAWRLALRALATAPRKWPTRWSTWHRTTSDSATSSRRSPHGGKPAAWRLATSMRGPTASASFGAPRTETIRHVPAHCRGPRAPRGRTSASLTTIGNRVMALCCGRHPRDRALRARRRRHPAARARACSPY